MGQKVVCEKCGKTFSKKFGLKRHLNSVHDSIKKYECKFCERRFVRNDMVTRHILMQHVNDPLNPRIKCEFCEKRLKNEAAVERHLKKHHPEKPVKKRPKERDCTFECNDCAAKFRYRQNLIRHIQTTHLALHSFECEKCGIIYKHKHYYRAHCREVHESNKKLICDKCNKNFLNERSLTEHVKTCSKQSKVTKVKPSIICIKCESTFPRYYLLLKHYAERHDIVLKYENREFPSFEEFLKWKRELEFFTIAGYHSSTGTQESSTTRVKKFRCHRSGVYRARCENDTRIRRLKKKGSKKLNGSCPAEISVKEYKSDGRCVIKFQTTHVGHEIGTQTELSHIYIDKTKRLELAAKIADRIPLTVIMENENEALISGNHDNRKRTITSKDLYNIKLRYAPDLTPTIRVPEDISTFIEQNKNSMLYFKNENADVSISALKKSSAFQFESSDFVLVFMTAEQKKNIELLAENRVISIQANQVLSTPVKFNLHTMMVLNLNQEGLPVAFLLTNREDDLVTRCFIECIKTEVGELRIKTLINGMMVSYFKSWSNVMPTPQYNLYCTSSVIQEWDRQCKKIPQQKREEFRLVLDKLHKEMDENRFRIMLDDFVCQTDPDYQTFLDFFRREFFNNPEHWAYCYRTFAEINTNADLHCKCNVLDGKKVRNVASCLDSMKNYLSFAYREEEMRKINGYTPSKLEALNSRHVSALEQMNDFTIYCVNELGTWQVIAPENIYTVCKQTPECQSDCLLKCVECNNVCLHEYTCSCMDHSVMYNMCEHIHTVLMIYSMERSEEVFPETYATITAPPISITLSNPPSPDHFVDDDTTKQQVLTKEEILAELRQKFRAIEQGIENLTADTSQWMLIKQILDSIPEKIADVSLQSQSDSHHSSTKNVSYF